MSLLALLSPVLGIMTSVVPDIIGIFRLREEGKLRIQEMEARAKYATVLHELKIDQLNIEADINESKSLYAHDSSIHGGKFMESLRASVRPVLTYSIFAVFVWAEIVLVMYAFGEGASMLEVKEVIWDDQTQSLFGAIMGFWFGSRAIRAHRDSLIETAQRIGMGRLLGGTGVNGR